jgi:Calpain family cysteine protease
VYVDDFLPFKGATSTSLYFAGKGDDNSLWMAFMEKIWAKSSGSYENIENGWS